jgi:hypothetical protein
LLKQKRYIFTDWQSTQNLAAAAMRLSISNKETMAIGYRELGATRYKKLERTRTHREKSIMLGFTHH